MAHYHARTFGLNRLRIDGDIRQKAAITAIMENVVIAVIIAIGDTISNVKRESLCAKERNLSLQRAEA